jgi:hypothetical protein
VDCVESVKEWLLSDAVCELCELTAFFFRPVRKHGGTRKLIHEKVSKVACYRPENRAGILTFV